MKNLMENLISLLMRKKIIKFSNIEDSFFLHKQLDKKSKLTTEIIDLNYRDESPYVSKESGITSVLSEEHLYLWFNRDKQKYLPEGLLLFRGLLSNYNSVCCLIKAKVDKVVVIKEGVLLSSFSKKIFTQSDIELMKNEFMINKVLIIKEDDYDAFLQKSYSKVKFHDLFNILKVEIDFKNLLSKAIKWVALPLFIASIVIAISMGGYSYYLEREKNKLFDIYQHKKEATSTLKEALEKNDYKNMQFNALLGELTYNQKTLAISSIIQVTDEMNITMQYIKAYNNKVEFIIKTDNQSIIPVYVKKLFNLKYFKEVKNVSSFKLHDKRIQITMTAELRKG